MAGHLPTLHMWSQVVGKSRLECAPLVNHWWQVPFYVTARGLTTSPIPYDSRIFQIDFDFIDYSLDITTDDGGRHSVALELKTVAAFYQQTMDALRELGIKVVIWITPVEVEDRTPFEQDDQHNA